MPGMIRKTENRYTTCLLKNKGNSDKINLLIDKHIFLFCTIVENVWKTGSHTAALSLACLKIRSRNEEAINSTRNETDLLAKCFLLPTLSTSILFACF